MLMIEPRPRPTMWRPNSWHGRRTPATRFMSKWCRQSSTWMKSNGLSAVTVTFGSFPPAAFTQDRRRAELRPDRLAGLEEALAADRVGLEEHGLAAVALDLPDARLALLLVPADDRDPRPGRGEPLGDRAAEGAGGADDDGDVFGEVERAGGGGGHRQRVAARLGNFKPGLRAWRRPFGAVLGPFRDGFGMERALRKPTWLYLSSITQNGFLRNFVLRRSPRWGLRSLYHVFCRSSEHPGRGL